MHTREFGSREELLSSRYVSKGKDRLSSLFRDQFKPAVTSTKSTTGHEDPTLRDSTIRAENQTESVEMFDSRIRLGLLLRWLSRMCAKVGSHCRVFPLTFNILSVKYSIASSFSANGAPWH